MTRTALIFFTTFVLYAAAIAVGIYLGVSQVFAQTAPQCAPRPDVIAGLARNYGEVAVAMGIAANGHMVEMFASPTGTWTITGTTPEGVTCLLATGAAFEAMAAVLPPQGIPG